MNIYLIMLGAFMLIIIGYSANAMLGNNSVIEEVAEGLLKKEYNIDVDFSESVVCGNDKK